MSSMLTDADKNWGRFVFFRVLFNSRFYYPVLAVLFIDLGLTPTQYTLLNFAWALAIVLTDVPAGVLADRWGRKPLVVLATLFMVLEMVLLLLAPWHGGWLLFLFCLGNRILSGMAEGMASGADEALVFDSLAERDRSSEWPLVLDEVMRWQSVGMVIAMLLGGAVYDPVLMNHLASGLGWTLHLEQTTTLRFPLYLNLLTALLALSVVLGFREPVVKELHLVPGISGKPETALTAWSLLLFSGKWILSSPVALFVLVGGLVLDSTLRLFLTFSSSYFRLISLPEYSFGLIGASLGGLGLAIPPIARRMVQKQTLLENYLVVFFLMLFALVGAAFQWPFWGVLFILPMGSAMMMHGYMGSYYLNAISDSRNRATVLSFRGLAFNLGYGFMGLLFAVGLKAFQDGANPNDALSEGFRLLPWWLFFVVCLLSLLFWKQRQKLFQRF